MEKEVAEYSNSSTRNLRDVIVTYNFDLTRDLPTQLGEIKLQYLNDDELAEKYKTLPKDERARGIAVIKIFPLYKDDQLTFAYNNYWFTYSEKGGFFSRKKLMFRWALEGGCHAVVGLDPSQKKFFIESVRLWEYENP